MLTVVVLLIGMIVAMYALGSGKRPVQLIIFGQALTVLGNPLMAGAMLYLANRRDVMGNRRNTISLNIVGGIGLLKGKNWARVLVIFLAVLDLIDFPIGTAIGVYTLWVLLNSETSELFDGGAKVQAQPAFS